MPPIGDTLREARMRQRLDIGDVEQRTKIRAKYLRALENEEFGLLPGPTFVKTFLRTYAEVLGLDAHMLVEEYRAQHEPRDELDLQPLSGSPPPRDGGRERRRAPGPPSRVAVVSFLVVALVAFLLILGLVGGDEEGGSQSASTEKSKTHKPAKRKKKPKKQAAPTAVTLSIAPVDPTYVCIDTGEGTDHVFEGILDQAKTFKGKQLRVNLGKRSPQVKVNGKVVQIEQGPTPIGFEFTPGATKELVEGQRPCA